MGLYFVQIWGKVYLRYYKTRTFASSHHAYVFALRIHSLVLECPLFFHDWFYSWKSTGIMVKIRSFSCYWSNWWKSLQRCDRPIWFRSGCFNFTICLFSLHLRVVLLKFQSDGSDGVSVYGFLLADGRICIIQWIPPTLN